VDGKLRELLREKSEQMRLDPVMPVPVGRRARRRRAGNAFLACIVVVSIGAGAFISIDAALKHKALPPSPVPATTAPNPGPRGVPHFFGVWPVDTASTAEAFVNRVKAGHDLWALEPNTEAVHFATHVLHWPKESVAVHDSVDMGGTASATIWNRDMSSSFSADVALNFTFGSPTGFPSVWVIERVASGLFDLQCPSIRQDVLVTGKSQAICGAFSQAPASWTVKATLSPAGTALGSSDGQQTSDIPVSGDRFDGSLPPTPDLHGNDAELVVIAYSGTGSALGAWVRRLQVAPESLASPGATNGDPTLSISPRSGPVGTVITLRGSNCFGSSNERTTEIDGQLVLGQGGPGLLIVTRSAPTSTFEVRYRIPGTAQAYGGAPSGTINPNDVIGFYTKNGVCNSPRFTVTP
jgi:hypothetical protein